jgi:hypothetical protein
MAGHPLTMKTVLRYRSELINRTAPALPPLTVSLCAQTFDADLLKHFTWRSVGPAGAGGRVVGISVAGAVEAAHPNR